MIISDLDYLESAHGDSSDDSIDALNGSAGAFIGVWAFAEGRFTITRAETLTFAFLLPHSGSLAIGIGGAFAIAYTPSTS